MTRHEKTAQPFDLRVSRLLLPRTYISLGGQTLSYLGAAVDNVYPLSLMRPPIPVKRAKLGVDYLGIAAEMKRAIVKEQDRIDEGDVPKGLSVDEMLEELAIDKSNAAAMKVLGHETIVDSVLLADTLPDMSDAVTLRTVDIARSVNTQPELLVSHGRVSEFAARRAEQLMIEVPTRVM